MTTETPDIASLVTERLRLEPQTVRQFDEWYSLERSRDELGHCDISEDEAWLRLCARQGIWAAYHCGFYFLRDRSSGEMVGEAGLQFRRRSLGVRFDPFPEASWAVSRAWQRQGIAAEAMDAILNRWFAAAGVIGEMDRAGAYPKIVALVSAANSASRRLAGRLGFRRFDQVSYEGEDHILYEKI